jgi:hypothetical protein
MKKVVFLMVIAIFVVISCEKDDILPVDTFTRADYVGLWSCTEVPLAKNQYFDCEIKIDNNNESNIKLTNFANLSGTAFAIVSGKNVVLPKQTINGNTIEGYGTMQNKNYITWRYYVKDNTDSASYNTNFNRK